MRARIVVMTLTITEFSKWAFGGQGRRGSCPSGSPSQSGKLIGGR